MFIPKGSNYQVVYAQFKAKKIKVESRYPGVFLYDRGKGLRWISQLTLRINGELKNIHIGMYSFSESGEMEAYKAYLAEIKKMERELGREIEINRLPKDSGGPAKHPVK